jgi:hypothetical protein
MELLNNDQDKDKNSVLFMERIKTGHRIEFSRKHGSFNKNTQGVIIGATPTNHKYTPNRRIKFSKSGVPCYDQTVIRAPLDKSRLLIKVLVLIERIGKSGKPRFKLYYVNIPLLNGKIINILNSATNNDVFRNKKIEPLFINPTRVGHDSKDIRTLPDVELAKFLVTKLAMLRALQRYYRKNGVRYEKSNVKLSEQTLVTYSTIDAIIASLFGDEDCNNFINSTLVDSINTLRQTKPDGISEIIKRIALQEASMSLLRINYMANIIEQALIINKSIYYHGKNYIDDQVIDKNSEEGKIIRKYISGFEKNVEAPLSDILHKFNNIKATGIIMGPDQGLLTEMLKIFY